MQRHRNFSLPSPFFRIYFAVPLKLIAAYPDKEVNDRETKKAKIQTIATELDQLSYDIDTFEYRDSVPDREAQVQMIANDIKSGNVKPLQIFLQTSIDEGIDEDSERQAKKLIAKLAEYKPLAKIEELEEQNYNMIVEPVINHVIILLLQLLDLGKRLIFCQLSNQLFCLSFAVLVNSLINRCLQKNL